MNKTIVKDSEIVATRVFDAPRDLVWKAWTDPNHVILWWGPRGFTNTNQEMDVRPGGIWRFIMHGPDGRDYPNQITFIEVKKPELLVYKHGGAEEVEPVDFHVTVNFAEEGKNTKLTMRMVFSTAEELTRVEKEYGAIQGLKECMDRLGEYLAKM